MKRSQKNKSRNKVRRRRHLKDERERAVARERNKYAPEPFVFSRFLKRRKIEISFIVFLAAGVLGIILLGPDKDAINEMRASVSSAIEEKAPDWDEAYPYGYKVIALTEADIVYTDFDTLPDDLKIDWKNISVVWIQTRQFGSVDEKLKVVIKDMDYGPAGVSGLSVTSTFIRKKGAKTILTRLGDLEFVAEIIEDTGTQLFCLFGLREG